MKPIVYCWCSMRLTMVMAGWDVGFPGWLPEALDCNDVGVSCTPSGMVEVPAGEFVRGPTLTIDEGPIAEVIVNMFFIDETEVTVVDYAQYTDSGNCTPPDDGDGCNWSLEGRKQHPVNCVSWYQADQYCRWVDDEAKRLPTEAEWEKAARGTDARKFPGAKSLAPG